MMHAKYQDSRNNKQLKILNNHIICLELCFPVVTSLSRGSSGIITLVSRNCCLRKKQDNASSECVRMWCMLRHTMESSRDVNKPSW
jgi:hypothetical protein